MGISNTSEVDYEGQSEVFAPGNKKTIDRAVFKIKNAKCKMEALDWLDIGADNLFIPDDYDNRPWNKSFAVSERELQKQILEQELKGQLANSRLSVLLSELLSAWDNLPEEGTKTDWSVYLRDDVNVGDIARYGAAPDQLMVVTEKPFDGRFVGQNWHGNKVETWGSKLKTLTAEDKELWYQVKAKIANN